MRLRKGKTVGQQKAKMNREVLGEEVKSDFINTACCGDVGVKGSKEPIDASCIEKEESGNAKEVDYEQNEICVSSGDCVGEGVLTQEEGEEEKDRPGVVAGEVQGGSRGRVAFCAGGLTTGVDARKALKRARLRAWKKYLRMEKAKLLQDDPNGRIDLKVKRDIGDAWKSLSQTVRDSYLCPEELLDIEYQCADSDGLDRSLSTRCCPSRVGMLSETMSSPQLLVVSELGFGSFMSLGDVNIKRELCLKLLEHIDMDILEIDYEGVKVTISSAQLARVMGVSDEGSEVRLYGSADDIKELKEKLCSHARGIPVNELVLLLKSCIDAEYLFRVMFTVLVMYAILAPGSGVVIPHRYLHGAVGVGEISKKNWSKWSFDFLVAGIRKFKKNISQQYVCGNLLFVQTMFFEAAAVGTSFVPKNVIPICWWSKSTIKKWMKKVNRSHRVSASKEHDNYDTGGDPFRGPSSRNRYDVSVAEAVSMLSVQVGKIMKFLGITALEENEGTSVMEELAKLNQVVTRLSSGLSAGCAMPSKGDMNCTKSGGDQGDDLEQENVDHLRAGKGLGDTVASPIGAKGQGNVAPYLDDETFLNELIRDPGDVEFVKKLIGRHREVDLKDAMTDVMKELAKAAGAENDSANREKEVLRPNSGKRKDVISISSGRSPVVKRRATRRKVVHYHLVNDDIVVVDGKHQFYKAGPFAIHSEMNMRDLKVLQYVFQPLFDSREDIVKLECGMISRSELLTLGPGRWVGDGVIDICIEYQTVMHRMNGPDEEVVWFLPTAYSQMVLSARDDIVDAVKAQGWKHSIMANFSRVHHINIPVNDSNVHWYLVVVLVEEQVVEVWDPKTSLDAFARRLIQVRKLIRSLDAVFAEEKSGLKTEARWNFADFPIQFRDDIGEQKNNFDCGLFVKKYLIDPVSMQRRRYRYNSDSERAALAVQFLLSSWNGMRTTLIELAERLYTEVQSGSVDVIHPNQVDQIQQERPVTKNLEEVLTVPDEDSNYIQQPIGTKKVDEEVLDNSLPQKRKRNTKSIKELLEGPPTLYVRDDGDSLDQSTNA